MEIHGCIFMYKYRMYLVHVWKYMDVFPCTSLFYFGRKSNNIKILFCFIQYLLQTYNKKFLLSDSNFALAKHTPPSEAAPMR
ncbi:hypothetical protein, partial [Butyrivibrio fibrisolvens]|uniref:hypothetical protein n=1 Tax=Butyrivibrio fibrisolvens TaxID=831 RepID=UPI001A981607